MPRPWFPFGVSLAAAPRIITPDRPNHQSSGEAPAPDAADNTSPTVPTAATAAPTTFHLRPTGPPPSSLRIYEYSQHLRHLPWVPCPVPAASSRRRPPDQTGVPFPPQAGKRTPVCAERPASPFWRSISAPQRQMNAGCVAPTDPLARRPVTVGPRIGTRIPGNEKGGL